MRRLKYSINVSLDGCGDHSVFMPGPDLHAHAAQDIEDADAIILGRRTYDLMEEGWRNPAYSDGLPAWVSGFRDTINAAKKYLVSSTPPAAGWNAELLQGDACEAVRRLKEQPGGTLATGGIQFPLALAEAGLIDDFEFVVHPTLVGHGPWVFAGLMDRIELRPVGRTEFESGAVALRYELAP